MEKLVHDQSAEHVEHIVMVPFMAHGHLIPFLSLAKHIQKRTGFAITIANTPLNINYLRSTISKSASSEASNINLAELAFCSTDYGLPPSTENTENLTLDKVAVLFSSSVNLEQPLRHLISSIVEKEGRPPLCIISDVFLGWASDLARSFGSASISFTTGGAYGTLAYISIWDNLPHRHTDSDEFSVPGFPEKCRFHRSHLHQFIREADGTDLWSKFFQTQIRLSLRSDGWLCNTVEEIEPSGMEMLRNYVKLPTWAIGPLLPLKALKDLDSSGLTTFTNRALKQSDVPPEKCLEWLNFHGSNSVLYISFGSQNTIAASNMMELAIGLEESNKPFIWVIRPPLGFDIKGEFKQEWLPLGFEERMKEKKRGLLVRNWAPQLEILSHRSIGAFLTHCGWNSIMESLSQGVPLIGWPMAAEQAYNMKMLEEEMGVGVELARGLRSDVVGKEVKKVIELVMNNDVEGKGKEMKKKAAEFKELIRAAVREEEEDSKGGSCLKAMDDFARSLLSKRVPVLSP